MVAGQGEKDAGGSVGCSLSNKPSPHPASRGGWVLRVNPCQQAVSAPAREAFLDAAGCQESLKHHFLSQDSGRLCCKEKSDRDGQRPRPVS